ncbi:MAG: hypothetical protein ACWA6U_14630 [Breznakibacter sp.]
MPQEHPIHHSSDSPTWHERTTNGTSTAFIRLLFGTYRAEAEPKRCRSGAEHGSDTGRIGLGQKMKREGYSV